MQVTSEEVSEEARSVPQSGLDIDTVFKRLLQTSPGFAGPLAAIAQEDGSRGDGEGGQSCKELFE